MQQRLVLRIITLIIGVGVCLGMLSMGLWQMSKYQAQGRELLRARAKADPVALQPSLQSGGKPEALYGLRVWQEGEYLDQIVTVVDHDGSRRNLAAFKLDDGKVLPVVRGIGSQKPPTGRIRLRGVFLPSEAGEDRAVKTGELSSVRLPQLQQLWPQPLTPGFITLDFDLAQAEGLTPVEARLPDGEGHLQNLSYAIQWWVFAAFGLGFSLVIERAIRHGNLSIGDHTAQ